MRLKLTLAYDGGAYSGWQMQAGPAARRELRTVQGEIERSIAALCGRRVPVHGAGRTDAGVHAEMQVCHLDVPENRQNIDWLRAVNVLLPPDIRVLQSEWVPASFHARKSASFKRYAYTLWVDAQKAVPRLQAFAWSVPPLDIDRMEEAFHLLCGRRDFASFQNGAGAAGTVRTLHSISRRPGVAASLVCPPNWPVHTFVFKGDGFLRQMVRNLMGLLVWVGQGKVAPEHIPAILEAGTRRALPSPTAPPQGLTLLEIVYPPQG